MEIPKKDDKNQRLGVTFHRTFPLNRPAIIQILRTSSAKKEAKKVSRIEFTENTTLGSIYLESMPRWGWGSGLLTFEKSLTAFGKYSCEYDSLLDQPGTQWLMHYHLSAPHGPGPTFWHEAVTRLFYAGNIFTAEELAETIGNFIWQTENRILAKRSVQSTATIFLGTYLKPDGLNKIRLLEATESGRYRVCEPNPAPIWAIACALVDYWQANYPGRLGIGLDMLSESPFIKLFLIGQSRLMEVLQAMQEAGYVEIHRTAPPYQVVLVRQDTEGLLNKLYGTD